MNNGYVIIVLMILMVLGFYWLFYGGEGEGDDEY